MTRGTLSIVAVGDIIPTRPLFPDGRPSNGFAEVAARVAAADVAVANLDIPLTASGSAREKLITVRASPELAREIRRVGFDVVSVANNHGMDYGETGLLETLAALEGAGLRHVGGGRDLASSTA